MTRFEAPDYRISRMYKVRTIAERLGGFGGLEPTMLMCAAVSGGIYTKFRQNRDFSDAVGDGMCHGLSLNWLAAKRQWWNITNTLHVRSARFKDQDKSYVSRTEDRQTRQKPKDELLDETPYLDNDEDDRDSKLYKDKRDNALNTKAYNESINRANTNFKNELQLAGFTIEANKEFTRGNEGRAGWYMALEAPSRYFLLSVHKHAMAATCHGTAARFFDPNAGEVTFSISAKLALFLISYLRNSVVQGLYLPSEESTITITVLKAM